MPHPLFKHTSFEDLIQKENSYTLSKGDIVFHEGHLPRYFYYLQKGRIGLANIDESGREFFQTIIDEEDTFGDHPLFINKPYPATAIIISTKAELIRIDKDKIQALFFKYPEVMFAYLLDISCKAYKKSLKLKELIYNDAKHKITTALVQYKAEQGLPADLPQQIFITRNELAKLTGLRVETVIRIIKKMEKKGELTIKNRKIIF